MTGNHHVTGHSDSVTIQDIEDGEWIPDKALFEGRIVGIHFEEHKRDKDDPEFLHLHFRPQLQIIVDIHYVTLANKLTFSLGEPDDQAKSNYQMMTLEVDISPDFKRYTTDSYDVEIAKLIPGNVTFGQPCLIVADKRAIGMKGRLLSIEPATDSSRKAFLETHSDYMVRFRRYAQSKYLSARWQAHWNTIHTALRCLNELNMLSSPTNTESNQYLIDRFDQALHSCRQQYLDFKSSMTSNKQELGRLVDQTTNPIHKRIYLAMIDDLQKAGRRLQEMRNMELDVRKDSPQFQGIILQTNPDLELSKDPP